MSKVVVFGDIHLPYHCRASVSRGLAIVAEEKPDIIVVLGDFFDCFNFSNFPRSLNVQNPQSELVDARLAGEDFWRIIHKRAPKAKCYQLTGNHEERIRKRILEKCPEMESLIDLRQLFKFNNVETVPYRQELVLNNVLYTHGFLSKLGDHARHYGMNCVVGHTHRPGIVYIPQFEKKTIFEANAGYLARPEDHPALQYTPTKYSKWTRSLLKIDDQGPRIILL